MLDYMRSLYRHQVWAEDELLGAVSAFPAAENDAELLRCLGHMAAVQRFYLARFEGRSFESVNAVPPPDSFARLAPQFPAVHAEVQAFLDGVTEPDLDRSFELPRLGARFTLREGMTQVILHSQNHRGQCLTRIRELGGKPPTLDFILWAGTHQQRPQA